MNSLLAVGARAVTMMIALITGITTTRMILGGAGVEHYALYTMLITIPSLLTFTDLGSGAVLVNVVATSEDLRTDLHLRRALVSVGRIVLMFAAGLMVINGGMLLSGSWERLFGDAGKLPGASLAAFFCITVFSLTLPFSLWSRIMLGQQKNHVVILLQGLISPLTMAGVWMALTWGGSHLHSYLAVASYLAALFVAVLGLSIVTHSTRPLVSTAASRVLRVRTYPGMAVMDVGWPMLAQIVTYPIAVGSQRYVLAFFGSSQDVAEYGIAGQVFFGFNSLVLAGGLTLWPYFTRQRDRGELTRGPFLISLLFGAAIASATLAVWAVGGWLFSFITQGEVDIRSTTIFAFGAMVMCTALVYPLGMFIMDTPGIRFQVIPTLSMAALGVSLSFLLTPVLGVSGPLVGVALAIVTCQLIPFAVYIRRHWSRLVSPATPVPNFQT